MSYNIDFTTFYDVLFSGDESEEVELNNSAANYPRLKIFFHNNNSTYNSVEICSPNGKSVDLTSIFNSTNLAYLKTKTVLISGTSIAQEPGTYAHDIALGGASTVSNAIFITRVEGWKF